MEIFWRLTDPSLTVILCIECGLQAAKAESDARAESAAVEEAGLREKVDSFQQSLSTLHEQARLGLEERLQLKQEEVGGDAHRQGHNFLPCIQSRLVILYLAFGQCG